MKLPFFTTIVILSAFSWFYVKTTNKKLKNADKEFWDRERAANSVRKKPLTDLAFIEIPFDSLPFGAVSNNEVISDCERKINALRDEKIVNLNGVSNTDLKFRYGVANLAVLTDYDQNYINLVQALSCWGKALYEADCIEEAKTVLSYGIDVGTDVRINYTLLADIYVHDHEYDKVEELIAKAEALTSINRNSIINELKERSVFSPSYK